MAISLGVERADPAPDPQATRRPLAAQRVLITGSTPLGINSPRRTMYTTDLDALAAGLRGLGAEVEWRPVVLGEDLSGYSHVVVETIEPASLAGSYLVHAMWTLAQRPDAIVHISDCKSTFGTNRTQFARLARVGERAVVSLRSRKDLDVYVSNPKVRAAVDQVIRQLASWDWPWRLMYSGMAVGDVQKLKVPRTDVTWYDPTSYVRAIVEAQVAASAEVTRERQWVAPFLTDRSSWLKRQKFTWPLIVVGGRSHAKAYRSLGRLPEADLIELWRRSYGFINIPYTYAGSNWWRAKYVFAAHLKSISIGSEVEHRLVLGDTYRHHAEVERMSDAELAQLGAAQAQAFWDIAWTNRDFNDYLTTTFRS